MYLKFSRKSLYLRDARSGRRLERSVACLPVLPGNSGKRKVNRGQTEREHGVVTLSREVLNIKEEKSMKKVMMIVLLTVVPSALRAEVTAGNSDLGAAREKASVQFDRLTAKDAGSAVVLADMGSSAKEDVPLVISESRKKALPSAVPSLKETSGSVRSMLKNESGSISPAEIVAIALTVVVGGLAAVLVSPGFGLLAGVITAISMISALRDNPGN